MAGGSCKLCVGADVVGSAHGGLFGSLFGAVSFCSRIFVSRFGFG